MSAGGEDVPVNAMAAGVPEKDAITALEEKLAGRMSASTSGPMKAIDPASIMALVNLFLGLFDACKSRFGQSKAMAAVQSPGRRETRIAQRLVLRDHFDGDRKAYRENDGDGIAETILKTASETKPSTILAAAEQYREDSDVLQSVSEAIDGV